MKLLAPRKQHLENDYVITSMMGKIWTNIKFLVGTLTILENVHKFQKFSPNFENFLPSAVANA